jgi:hypothetical protein
MMNPELFSHCPEHVYYAYHLGQCPVCDRKSDILVGIGISSQQFALEQGEYLITTAKPKQKGNKVEFEGYIFDSQTEYKRYLTLSSRLAAGIITSLEVHPSFELLAKIPKLQSAITYTADFAYWFEGRYIIEDSKGVYGNSQRNRKRGIAGKAMDTPESRATYDAICFQMHLKYGALFEFRIITNPDE